MAMITTGSVRGKCWVAQLRALALPARELDHAGSAAIGAEAVCAVPALQRAANGNAFAIERAEAGHDATDFAEMRAGEARMDLEARIGELANACRILVRLEQRQIGGKARAVIAQPEQDWRLAAICQRRMVERDTHRQPVGIEQQLAAPEHHGPGPRIAMGGVGRTQMRRPIEGAGLKSKTHVQGVTHIVTSRDCGSRPTAD